MVSSVPGFIVHVLTKAALSATPVVPCRSSVIRQGSTTLVAMGMQLIYRASRPDLGRIRTPVITIDPGVPSLSIAVPRDTLLPLTIVIGLVTGPASRGDRMSWRLQPGLADCARHHRPFESPVSYSSSPIGPRIALDCVSHVFPILAVMKIWTVRIS